MSAYELRPPMAQAEPLERDHGNAVWVGSADFVVANSGEDIVLQDGGAYSKARLLIWDFDRVRGFVEVPVRDSTVSSEELCRAVVSLPVPDPAASQVPVAPTSVVVCTRDRAHDLRLCLEALLQLDFATFEVIVVDNAPSDTSTLQLVRELADPHIRYMVENKRGLARARNAGVRSARYDYIAFTDDDVVVDRRWLTALHRGFSLGADVDCVTGMVATGQLQSRSQRYFDRRVSWARNVNRTIFRLQDPPPDMPLFPFQFGAYGTGANFSARRSALFELGGFDEALGVGSPTAGGEDIDFFIRVVLANRALVYLPDAVVWHKHRADDEGLKVQLENYGRGLGAVLTKLACERRARRLMATRLVRGIRHARQMVRVETATRNRTLSGLGGVELRGILRGPYALHRARRSGLVRPLKDDVNPSSAASA
ncbi:MAG: glycosyltransferase [Acidimicrobiales bacterium]